MTAPPVSDTLKQCLANCIEMDAPLNARLSAMANEVRRLEPAYTAIVDAMVQRLLNAESGANAPKVGEVMPPFVLPDDEGRLVSLAELLKRGQVVIAFHRGHWCSYCRISASALAEIETKVVEAGGQLVVITPELATFNRLLKAEAGAHFPVLTDLDCGYALDLRMAIRFPAEMIEDLRDSRTEITNYHNNDNWIFPIPATFVVGQDGIVKARYVDPDYRKRMELDDLLAGLAG